MASSCPKHPVVTEFNMLLILIVRFLFHSAGSQRLPVIFSTSFSRCPFVLSSLTSCAHSWIVSHWTAFRCSLWGRNKGRYVLEYHYFIVSKSLPWYGRLTQQWHRDQRQPGDFWSTWDKSFSEMPTSLWHLGTCDPFHIICLNGHNYPGLPMIIEVTQEQQHEVTILDATLAVHCSCSTIRFLMRAYAT